MWICIFLGSQPDVLTELTLCLITTVKILTFDIFSKKNNKDILIGGGGPHAAPPSLQWTLTGHMR